jgi:hypothetical protein
VDLFAIGSSPLYYDDISLDASAVDIPWLSETPTSGAIPVGGSTHVDVTFDFTGLGFGTHNATFFAMSNDSDKPVVYVPVTFNVVAPDIAVTAPAGYDPLPQWYRRTEL